MSQSSTPPDTLLGVRKSKETGPGPQNKEICILDRVKTKVPLENRKRFHVELNATQSRHKANFESQVGERFQGSNDLK